MDQVLSAFHQVPHSVWMGLFALVVSAVLSVLVQVIKHYLEGLNEKTLMTLLGTFSFAASAINYLLGHAQANPTILGQETATLVGLATVMYRFAVKPGYSLLIDAKATREAKASQTAPQAAVTTVSTLSVSNGASPTGEANF